MQCTKIHKIHYFVGEKLKIFWGGGTALWAPSPDTTSGGEGTLHPFSKRNPSCTSATQMSLSQISSDAAANNRV